MRFRCHSQHLRWPAVLLGAWFSVAPLAAQSIVLRAPLIDDAWVGHDGQLGVQVGRRVMRLTTRDRAPAVRDAYLLPPDLSFFDEKDGVLVGVGASGVVRQTLDGQPSPGTATRPPGAADDPWRTPRPVRLAAFAAGVREPFLPDRSGISVRLTDSSPPVWIGAERRVDRVGFGLTAQVTEETRLPWFFVIPTPAGPRLVREADHGFVVEGAARPTVLRPVPIDDRGGIEGFDWNVAPLVADLDHDGVPELVRVDSGKGVIAIQRGLAEVDPPPPQVIVLGTPIIAAGACDLDGDGKDELWVVRLPALNALQQLSILAEGRVAATVLAYAAGPDGNLATTPLQSRSVPLGITVSIRDDRRSGRFATLIVARQDGVLSALPGRAPEVLPWDGSAGRAMDSVPAGEWVDALRVPSTAGFSWAILRTKGESLLVAFPR